MSKNLEIIRRRLCLRLRYMDATFDRQLRSPSFTQRRERYAFQDGLISALWQSWCIFCRAILMASASGTNTKGGKPITSPYLHLSESQLAYVMRQLSLGEQIRTVKSLKGMYLEPAWGGVQIFQSVNRANLPLSRCCVAAGFGIRTPAAPVRGRFAAMLHRSGLTSTRHGK